jgi:hypothetical protein
MKVVPLSFLLGIAIYSNLPPMQPHQQEVDPSSFLLGIAVAVVVGFLAFRFGVWWGNVSRMWKKQVVEHTTAKTPWDVVIKGIANLFLAILIVGLAIVIFYLITNK